MRIGDIEARKGAKAFGFLKAVETHGRFDVHVPLHIVQGASDGPVLLVQAGVSGLEIEPAMVLPKVVRELNPAEVSGTLLLVPLLNTSGFEFEQVNAIWDDKDLNTLGRGKADGTVSEQMIHFYYDQVVARADAVVDIHTGALWGYFRYAGVYKVGAVDKSKALAVALGLPQVLLGQPEDRSLAFEAAKDGKAVVSAWIGGGPGLRDYREEDLGRVRRAVLNAMRQMGMLPGKPELSEGKVSVIEAHTVLKVTGERGLTFMAKEKRGQKVRAGEKIGYVRHPYTGDIIQEFVAPREGVMLHAGAAWPILPEGVTLAILGDLVEEAAKI
ncbi:MAG: succinylglutamate desuccinylase/aspartoacylase family protein [Anaerolineae bacterium]